MTIKYLDIVNNFSIHLKNNPELMPSSTNVYIKIIKELTNRFGIDPSVQQLNQFITEKSRKRQAHTTQAALKYYLRFRWRNKRVYNELVEQLVKARARPPIRKKVFLNRTEAIDIIDSIAKPEHQLVAKMQYFTGGRASEIIAIKKSNIVHESEFKRIRIDIIGKGDRFDPIYLTDSLWVEVQQYMIKESSYLFLNDEKKILTEEQLRTKTESYYKRYYDSLKQAAKSNGMNIATHDWRRSFAQSLKEDKTDTHDIQKALRHKSMDTTEKYFKDDSEAVSKTMLKHQHGI